jgi:cell wall-associated NlpC family hydrolase
MNKYRKYVGIKHSWEDINCLTLIEWIYKEHLNIDFMPMWKRAQRENGTTAVDRHWYHTYGASYLLNELEYWTKIDLSNVQEFDILIFVTRSNLPVHFGMFIGDNRFIEILENNYSQITELDDKHRRLLQLENTSAGIYRHKEIEPIS